MKKLCVWLLLPVLFLTGCSVFRPKPIVPHVPDIKILPFDAQQWLWQIPQGDYAVGISYSDTFYTDGADDAAKDFAAVGLSRNHSSYIVDKDNIITMAEDKELDLKQASFNVVVSEDLDYLRRASKELKLVGQFDTKGYFLGLYGFLDTKADTLLVTMNPAQPPAWISRTGVRKEKKKILSVASSRQVSLMDAFSAAQELALRYLGQYILRDVTGEVRAENNVIQRNLILETVTRSRSVFFDKVFIRQMKIDGNESYEVFLQLMQDPATP
ncbi:MAG TPA: hypothetical protein PL124_09845 [Candidatus Cloacimonadota bacterium]|nr:hypothetical protein [Candidatus Cloacimonadota bacterium]HPS39701.1 hypothetical protein [Candidatus Cloacimonadota bacterium]